MKLKRNTLTLVLVLVLGLTLFTAATVAASSANVGYEAFKETLEEMDHEEATWGQVTVVVTDNGENVLELKAEGVGHSEHEDFSADVSLSDGQEIKELEIYGQEDKIYIIDLLEEDYYQMLVSDEMKDGHRDHDKDNHDMTAIEEELLDYFVGDLKENFVVVEANDGSKELIFEMTGSEVPTGLNLLIKAATSAEHRTENQREDHMEKMPFMSEFDFEGKTELTDDVQLEDVTVKFNVNEQQQFTDMMSRVVFSGKDDKGSEHEIIIQTKVTLGYDEVSVTSIDAGLYDWEVIDHSTEHEGNMRSKNHHKR